MTEGDDVNGRQDGCHSKKESEKKNSPSSTLESSFEEVNVKKFDVAVVADPLYHQTSAQFQEGGAKGLLLNNTGVYGDCRVLFDSLEVPGKGKSSSHQNDVLDIIDISFAKVTESLEQMVMNMLTKDEISPTLRDIVCLFDEHGQRSSVAFTLDKKVGVYNSNEVEMENNTFGSCEARTLNHDDKTDFFQENFTDDSAHPRTYEENESCAPFGPEVDQSFVHVTMYLFQEFGINSTQIKWACPDYWRFRKSYKCPGDFPAAESGSAFTTRKGGNQADVGLDFMKSLDGERVDIFAPPKYKKSLLLPANRAPCNNTFSEDCHYQSENLVKLFLLPDVLCLGKKRRESVENADYSESAWGNDSSLSGQYDDGYFQGVESADDLISQLCKVKKNEVQYERTSKQVDVQALKKNLWDHIQESAVLPEIVCKGIVSFKHVLATFPVGCQAAAVVEDISPHLCFICLLHLASEHRLSIQDCPNLDDLSIHLPPPCHDVDGVPLFS